MILYTWIIVIICVYVVTFEESGLPFILPVYPESALLEGGNTAVSLEEQEEPPIHPIPMDNIGLS